MTLAGKVILITGSTTGVGEAIARRCVESGARVLVHGRDAVRGEQLVAELGDAAVFHRDDLRDAAAPARMVETAVGSFGRLDGLVNNAAYIVRSDLQSTTAELFDEVIAVNLRAPLLLIQASLPHLKQARGVVVNIGSVNGYGGASRQLAYSISKGGMTTMTRNLADALAAESVRIVQLTLGWVLTPNEHRLKVSEGLAEDWSDHPPESFVPSGRMTRPEDVARVAVFWLSDASRPFNGGVFELEQYPWLGRHPPIPGERTDDE